jgi:hypothetical protein
MEKKGYPVHRMQTNLGPHAWRQTPVERRSEWFAVADCDLDLSTLPGDALEVMKAVIDGSDTAKAAASLELRDIPADAVFRAAVLQQERQHWDEAKRTPLGFRTPTDTTFYLSHRKREPQYVSNVYDSIRLDRPYTIRHLPWYATSLDWFPPDYVYMMQQTLTGVDWSARFQQKFKP